ncbi:hypothetical protein EW146_g9625 [Bondarzewia mesenterica]|uniref:Uncharacterized protein n=1 Tax=Bondarzewia mesenterica TaxID=1095465 RepID=A0A4S4L637_9AGAM|nr:hypothetical protein EW146_g9625 [Bondarzewia mesenterica]
MPIRRTSTSGNRQRQHLANSSWCERRHAAETASSNADGGGDVEVETLEDGVDADCKSTEDYHQTSLRNHHHLFGGAQTERSPGGLPSSFVLVLESKVISRVSQPPLTPRSQANEDTVDIVSFLVFEMVRSLTVAFHEVKKSLEESYLCEDHTTSPVLGKCKVGIGLDSSNK